MLSKFSIKPILYIVLFCCQNSLFSQVELKYDTLIYESISTVGEQDDFTFQGRAGQVLSLRGIWTGCNLNLSFTVVAPSGEILVSSRGECFRKRIVLDLVESGTYQLKVVDDDEKTGAYQLFMQDISVNSPAIINLKYDTIITSDIANTLETDIYTFDGTIGQSVFLRGSILESGRRVVFEITAPSGEVLYTSCITCDKDVFLDLEETGIYRLIVWDDKGEETGDYQVSLQDISHQLPSIIPIAYDTIVTDNIEEGLKANVYSFYGTTNDYLSIIACEGSTRFRITAPSGIEVFYDDTGTTNCGLLKFFSLKETGNYKVVLFYGAASTIGNYDLLIQNISNAPNSKAIEYDAIFNQTEKRNIETDVYTFQGMTGDYISIRSSWNSPSPDLYYILTAPSGKVIYETKYSTASYERLIFLDLEETGTFQLLLYDFDYANLDSYQLLIQNIGNAPHSISLDDKPVTQAVFEQGLEIDVYTFQGEAGTTKELTGTWKECNTSSWKPTLRFRIIAPSGELIYDKDPSLGSCDPTIASLNLLETGTYQVLVFEENARQEGAYDLIVCQEMEPLPVFTYEVTENTVSFQNDSQFGRGYSWSFGNGQVSMDTNPTMVYTASGTYEVCLTAFGCTEGGGVTICKAVTIEDPTSSCRYQDSLALVALYNATDGANWTTTWDLNQPMDSWFGLKLDENGCVLIIDLDGQPGGWQSPYPGNNLRGSIPPVIGNLAHLERLILARNKNLIGTIPPELGNLQSLRVLSTTFCEQLTGSIPPELGKLSNLETLELYDNDLTGSIPLELGNLENLKNLSLPINALVGSIPTTFQNLTKLEGVNLSNNKLSGSIPDVLGSITTLISISLGGNELTGNIPASLGNLSNLEVLSLLRNKLSGSIPFELGDLRNLRDLSLYGNNLTGSIPPQLANLTNLEHFRLNDNQLTGVIPSFNFDPSILKYFNLGHNNLSACYPDALLENVCPIGVNTSRNPVAIGYSLLDNPLLPWQGDITRFCSGKEQIGAPCDDSNPNTQDDQIQEDCTCAGTQSTNNDNPNTQSSTIIQAAACDLLSVAATLFTNTDTCSIQFKGNPRQLGCFSQGAASINLDKGILLSTGNVTDAKGPNKKLDTSTKFASNGDSDLALLNMGGAAILDGAILEFDIIANSDNLTIEYVFASEEYCEYVGSTFTDIFGIFISGLGIEGPFSNNSKNLATLPESTESVSIQTINYSNNSDYYINNLSSEATAVGGCTAEEILISAPAKGLIEFDGFTVPLEAKISTIIGETYHIKIAISDVGDRAFDSALFFKIKTPNVENCQVVNTENCRVRDSLVLIDLYNSTDGINWTNPWILSQPMDNWFGITLNNDGCVTHIQLIENQLRGSIPSDLGKFPNLIWLNLSNNQLTGSIPVELGNLSNLFSLSLGANELTGNIPVELGKLTELSELWLFGNQLTGEIPGELGNLSLLMELRLFDNQLTGTIPADLGKLPELTLLDLANNDLKGCIPDNFSKFCQYEQGGSVGGYDLRNNSKLPWQGDLTNFCNGEPQVGASCDDGNLNTENDKIQEDCICRGTAPVNECKMRDSLALVILYEATDGVNWNDNNNWLSDLPLEDWSGISTNAQGCVTNIHLSYNNLSGQIPSEIGNLDFLKTLHLSNNQITGTILSELGNLDSLETLNLSNNQLTGTLPSELGNLKSIWSISLINNQLFGCIPDSYQNLCGRASFSAAGNPLLPWEGEELIGNVRIHGGIPVIDGIPYANHYCFGKPQIGAPCIDGNPTTKNDQITENCECVGTSINIDCITRDKAILTKLYDATNGDNWVNNENWLTDTLKNWYGIETNTEGCVTSISLEDNNLSGYLPNEMGDLAELEDLRMSENNLSEAIPEKIGDLIRLEFLDFGLNQLSGKLPEFGQLTNLKFINLSGNQLSGTIPNDLDGLDSLQSLFLGLNELSGTIPNEISSLKNLQRLSLSDNKLTGNIPPSIGNLKKLENLYLSYNNLTGEIPPEIGNLLNLRLLHLNNNQLTGEIPLELGNLSNYFFLTINPDDPTGNPLFIDAGLVELYLSNNQLIGCFPETLIKICENRYNEQLDSIVHNGRTYHFYDGWGGYNFTNNSGLPWEGDFVKWCNGEEQIGASCEDGNPNTENDQIQEDCTCRGTTPINKCVQRDSLALVALYEATNGPNWINTWDLTQPMQTWYGVRTNAEGCVDNLDLDGEADYHNGSKPTGNGLQGSLPAEITMLLDITEVRIAFNAGLNGIIPSTIGDLAALKILRLNENKLSGTIPTTISQLTTLEELHLANNNLSGTIPVGIGNLSALSLIEFRNNQLRGTIPASIGQLSQLQTLHLTNNQLSGNIPSEFGNLSELRYCFLSSNQLTGTIPASLGNLPKVIHLMLHNNQLEGIIPASLTNNLLTLEGLNLGNNQLSGIEIANPNIPWSNESWLGLQIHNNQFTFEDILLNIDINGYYKYEQQDSFYVDTLITLDSEEPLLIDLQIDAAISSNQYTWYKDGQIDTTIMGENQLHFDNIQKEDEGVYRVAVTNATAPNLILHSRSISIVVNEVFTCSTISTDLNATICEGDNYSFGTQELSATGNYTDTLSSYQGCDSIVQLNLVVEGTNSMGVAKVEMDQSTCNSSFSLVGNQPANTVGYWETTSNALIQDPNNAQTLVQNLLPGGNVFTWTLSTDNCPDYDAARIIIFRQLDVQAIDDTLYFEYGKNSEINVLDNDLLAPDTDWSLEIQDNTNEGRVFDNQNGKVTYAPPGGFYGTTSFTYELCSTICEDCSQATVTVILLEPKTQVERLFIPSGFTPDGDGINDSFIIPALAENPEQYPDNQLTIFSRWGEIVFEAQPYENNWNGTFQKTGKDLPAGTYYYIARLNLGEGLIKRGDVTVIR